MLRHLLHHMGFSGQMGSWTAAVPRRHDSQSPRLAAERDSKRGLWPSIQQPVICSQGRMADGRVAEAGFSFSLFPCTRVDMQAPPD